MSQRPAFPPLGTAALGLARLGRRPSPIGRRRGAGENAPGGLASPLDDRRRIPPSSANLFQHAKLMPIPADEAPEPGSPYGESKLMLERALAWYERLHGLRFAALRYFNAAGATERVGEHHLPETHIIP